MGQRVERLVKLVRGRAGQLWSATGIEWREAESLEEHRRLLRQKLIEEAAEYVTDPSLDELADVMEVCEALASVDFGRGYGDLRQAQLRRRAERGDFGRFGRKGLTMWMTGELNPGEVPDSQARVVSD